MQLDAASRAGAGFWKTPRNRGHGLVALLAVLASILMTWPLARSPGDQLLGAAYHWDAYTNAMLMGSRVDAALGRSALSLYDSYYFAPLPHSIAFNENHFGLSFLFAPFYLLSDNPLLAYNLTLLASLSLSVFFSYLLVLRLTGSVYAGLIAGVAFAFCPYVLFEIGRIQLVATQWIPATFLFLHRALEGQRRRDIAGFWSCALLQLGTCLYYAMFLLPLLATAFGVLLFKKRPARRFYLWFGACALLAGGVACAMVYPYFAARHEFNLQRSLEFASSYDGKLGFFANVSDTNRSLTAMHYRNTKPGAHEEVAFPGFSVLLFALLALAVPAFRALRRAGAKQALSAILAWSALFAFALGYAWLEHSVLPSALALATLALFWRRARSLLRQPFHGRLGLYFGLLLLSLVLFLGVNASPWEGTEIRGLYYYLYSYVPGFDGIRKVSRQAVMTTFIACMLSGFGVNSVFSKLRRARERVLSTALVLAALCYELRCFPHPIEKVWAGDSVPNVLRFAATLPEQELIASIPQNEGKSRFGGDAGMAFHNYLSLYHRHRFVNGQSSWQPPVTELAQRALERLPDEGARRTLLSLGTRELIVFGEELEPERARLPAVLAARPAEYRRIFAQGSHSLFTLLGSEDPSVQLADTPALPAGAERIASSEMRAVASLRSQFAGLAVDDDIDSFWTAGRDMEQGQSLELQLSGPRPIVALEIENPTRALDVPVSYRLTAENGAQDLGVVAEQRVLRFYRGQIFAPARFVFRLVFSRPIVADRLRLTVEQPVPGFYFSVHELRLYAAPSGN